MDYMLDLATRFFRRLATVREFEEAILTESLKERKKQGLLGMGAAAAPINWTEPNPPEIFLNYVSQYPEKTGQFLCEQSSTPNAFLGAEGLRVSRWRLGLYRLLSRIGLRSVPPSQPTAPPAPDLPSRAYAYIRAFENFDLRIAGLVSNPGAEVSNGSERRRAELFWGWKDERSRQMLMELMYRDPELAREIASVGEDLCPGFICYLAEEVRTILKEWPIWQIRRRKDADDVRLHLQQIITHEQLPDPIGNPGKFKLALIGSPDVVRILAYFVECAVPFSMVLRSEVEEIKISRRVRLEEDFDAQAAVIMYRLARLKANIAGSNFANGANHIHPGTSL